MSSRRRMVAVACAAVALGFAGQARSQTSLSGSTLALRSGGSSTLTSASYVGTYLTVPAGGATVSFTVTAAEAASGSGTPHVNLVIADSVTGFNVSSTSATAYATPGMTLPAGTYLVRAERDYPGNTSTSRAVTVSNLSVSTLSGGAAAFSNASTDANALAAADTYISNYRRGSATVALSGPSGLPLLAGTPVNVDMGRVAFDFGDAVPGTSGSTVNAYIGSNGTTQQTTFQQHLNQNFNAVTPENIGKWSSDEAAQGNVQMSGVDAFLSYARTHQMPARMHNLIWATQQPNFANALLTNAANGTTSAASSLRAAISSRIDYYVGTSTQAGSADRDLKYTAVDVYNESYHTGSNSGNTTNYWSVLGGAPGVAGVYNEVASQIAASGSTAKTYVNEYNVLQNNGSSYASFYLSHVNAIRNAGGNVGGIGVQYYPESTAGIGTGDSQHSPARIASTLASLSTEGLPITLTEFGVGSGGATGTPAQILSDTLRLTFGSPNVNGFYMWGFDNDSGGATLYKPAASFYNVSSDFSTWTITQAGQAWQDMLGIQDWDGNPNNGWTTNFATTTDASGTISISNGYYGAYYLSNQRPNSLGAKVLPFDFTLAKGVTAYSQSLAKPPNWFFWKLNGSGTWGAGANWTDAPESGGTPSSAGFTAYFGSSATTYSLADGSSSTVAITKPVTVTLSSPATVGMLVFDGASGYTIAGAGMTLRGYVDSGPNAAAIDVLSGSHSVTAPLTLASDTTVSVAAVGSTLTLTQLQASPVALTKSGPGTLVANAYVASSLAVTGGIVRAISNSASPSVLATVPTLWAGASFDLTNDDLVISAAGDAALGSVRSLLVAGAVTSSSVAVDPALYALGYGDAATLGVASFDGVSTSAGATLVKFTYVGDTDLSGLVDGSDLANLLAGMNGGLQGWTNGDLNYDGVVDGTDLSMFLYALRNQGAPLGSSGGGGGAVPEPGLCVMFAVPLGLLCRGRRKSE